MNIEALKEILHQKIEGIDDEQLLEAVHVILSKNQKVFEIPATWKADIDEARMQYGNKQYYNEEEFQEKMKKWE